MSRCKFNNKIVKKVNNFIIKGREKEKCQDASFSKMIGESVILSVADGIGSKKGSELASQKLTELVQTKSDFLLEIRKPMEHGEISKQVDNFFYEVINEWRNWHHDNFSNDSWADSTFTILIFIRGYLFLRSIGDSILFVWDSEGYFDILMSSEDVRDNSGGTPSIKKFLPQLMVTKDFYFEDIKGIFLSTDGLEELVESDGYNGDSILLHEWMVARIREGFLESDIYNQIKVFEDSFINQPGLTKGDDIGVAYATLS